MVDTSGEQEPRRWARVLWGGIAVLATASLIGAHQRVEFAGPTYQGLLMPLDRIYDVACAGGLVVLAWASGRSTVSRTGFAPESPVVRFLVDTAVGLGVVGTLLLVLGAASLLDPWALAVGALSLMWLSRDALLDLPAEASLIHSELRDSFGAWGLLALAAVALVLLLQAATPPGDWDVLTYHLDIPREFLARGKVFLPEDNHHVAFIGLQQILYVPLLALGAESAPAALSAMLAVLLALSVYAFGSRLVDATTGSLATWLVWGSPAIPLVAVTARVDVTVTWLLVLAHFAIVVAWEGEESDGWLWMAAVLGGLAVATKMSALAYLVGLAPVVIWWALRRDGDRGRRVTAIAGFGLIAAVVAAPWLLKNLMLLGSPVYPYLTELRLESWLAGYLGTTQVPADVNPDALRVTALTHEPFSIVRLFTEPSTMAPEREGAFYFPSFALAFVPLAFLQFRRELLAVLAPPLLYLIVVLVADDWVNLRYLIPVFVVGSLLASIGVVRAGRWLFSASWLRHVLLGLVIGVGLIPAVGALSFKVAEMRTHELWLGVRSEAAYLENNPNPDVFVHARLRDRINRELPADAKIAMLFESRGYGFAAEVLQDNLSRNWPILASGEPWRDCLGPTGATHVLVNYGHLASQVGRGLTMETVDWSAFSRFARACLQAEMTVGSVVLYRIASHLDSARRAAFRMPDADLSSLPRGVVPKAEGPAVNPRIRRMGPRSFPSGSEAEG